MPFRLIVATLAAFFLVALFAACDSDGSNTGAREYFNEISEIVSRHGAEVEAAQAAYHAVLAADLGEEKEVGAILSPSDVEQEHTGTWLPKAPSPIGGSSPFLGPIRHLLRPRPRSHTHGRP